MAFITCPHCGYPYAKRGRECPNCHEAIQWCLISTSVERGPGLADDCIELQVLRGFRDSWMRRHHPLELDRYRVLSPRFIDYVEAGVDPDRTYSEIFSRFLAPGIAAVRGQRWELAFAHYVDLVDTLEIANLEPRTIP